MPENKNAILVPAASPDQLASLLPVLLPIARGREAPVTLLHVHLRRYSEPAPAPDAPDWLDAAAADLRAEGVVTETLRTPGHNIAGVIRETVQELRPQLLLLSWRRGGTGGDVTLHSLLLDVPCDVAVLRCGDDMPPPRRILIPSAGGPNAALAMQLAGHLERAYDGELTMLSVLPASAGESAFADTHQSIRDSLRNLLPDEELESVGVRVIRERTPTEGILKAARPEEFDLLMIGASREGVLQRLAFGEVPERVAQRADVAVLVIKRPLSRSLTLARRLWDSLTARAPTLNEADKIEVYRDIRRSARADTDFYTMMSLSTAIAALGLILNSPAVVIGAMLVAPLMSAIIALGLGVVQGDARLLRLGFITSTRGALLAVAVGFAIGLLIPGTALTDEMRARGSPQLVDLGVAVAAGAAGAYALCRKGMSASLPGVAIAVALVPPLATLGLGLSLREWGVAGGASLLFLTNLVGIAVTGGSVFLLLGFQPEPGRTDRMRLFTRGWRGLLLLLLLIAIPLTALTRRSLSDAAGQRQMEQLTQKLTLILDYETDNLPGLALRDFAYEFDDDGVMLLTVEVESTGDVRYADAVAMQDQVIQALDRPVELVLKLIPTTRLDPRYPPTPPPTLIPTVTPSPTASPTPTATLAPTATATPET